MADETGDPARVAPSAPPALAVGDVTLARRPPRLGERLLAAAAHLAMLLSMPGMALALA
ncbi:MAG: hypothetical protein IVW57_17775, partial [Ktedonobacterales bacterium]|nr:hypothetical protein [Ktedonobacterales bacterium]